MNKNEIEQLILMAVPSPSQIDTVKKYYQITFSDGVRICGHFKCDNNYYENKELNLWLFVSLELEEKYNKNLVKIPLTNGDNIVEIKSFEEDI